MERTDSEDLEIKVSKLMEVSSKVINPRQVARLGVGFGIKIDGDFPIIINPVKNIIYVSNPSFYEAASKLKESYHENNFDFVLRANYPSIPK